MSTTARETEEVPTTDIFMTTMRVKGSTSWVDANIGIDSCSQVDAVDLSFARRNRFDEAKSTSPALSAASRLEIPTRGVFKVPFDA